MTDDERNPEPAGTQRAQDDQAALERELSREAAEGQEAIGDMRENRNLSGSSTWETMVDGERSTNEGDRPEVF
jgi:hypothetical protein